MGLNAKDLAVRIRPEVGRLWPDDPDGHEKARSLAEYIAALTHNFREGWGVCRCGKEYPVWVADDHPAIADMRMQMYENPNIDSCRRCGAEFLVRFMKETDRCPEGDCTGSYAHGPAAE